MSWFWFSTFCCFLLYLFTFTTLTCNGITLNKIHKMNQKKLYEKKNNQTECSEISVNETTEITFNFIHINLFTLKCICVFH